MDKVTQLKLESLADSIDNLTMEESSLRIAAIEVVRKLKGDDAEAYIDAANLFDARTDCYQTNYKKIIGDINRFTKSLREIAIRKGFIKIPEPKTTNTAIPTQQPEPKAEAKNECPECKAEVEEETQKE